MNKNINKLGDFRGGIYVNFLSPKAIAEPFLWTLFNFRLCLNKICRTTSRRSQSGRHLRFNTQNAYENFIACPRSQFSCLARWCYRSITDKKFMPHKAWKTKYHTLHVRTVCLALKSANLLFAPSSRLPISIMISTVHVLRDRLALLKGFFPRTFYHFSRCLWHDAISIDIQ